MKCVNGHELQPHSTFGSMSHYNIKYEDFKEHSAWRCGYCHESRYYALIKGILYRFTGKTWVNVQPRVFNPKKIGGYAVFQQ